MLTITGLKPLEQIIHGDYVATPIPNAFNSNTAYWISRRGYSAAFYIFTVEECISLQDLKDRLTADAFKQYESWFGGTGSDAGVDVPGKRKAGADNLTPVLNALDASNRSHLGDFVRCENCGRYMLVNHGQAECPECAESALTWADKMTHIVASSESWFHDHGYELLDRPGYENAR